jgi:hypothetical protein
MLTQIINGKIFTPQGWLVLNNVKNKLIHRIFAVVRDGQMYEKQYVHPLK